jgi:hypothetical protein
VFNSATGPEVFHRPSTFNLTIFVSPDVKDLESGQSSTRATDARQRRKTDLALVTARCRYCLLYLQPAGSEKVSGRATADVVVALLSVEVEDF